MGGDCVEHVCVLVRCVLWHAMGQEEAGAEANVGHARVVRCTCVGL